jgi:phosphate transport system substrate-binding protein
MNKLASRLVSLRTALTLCLVLGVIPKAFTAPEPPPTNAPLAEPLAETRRVEEEIRKLNATPIGKEIAALNARVRTLLDAQNKERLLLEQQSESLHQTEAYREYEKKLRELEQQRSAKWEAERRTIAEAARLLYAARHEELLKRATTDLSMAKRLGFDVLTYPRVDGSTSTHPLSVIIASRLLGTPYEWIYPEPTGNPWGSRSSLPAGLFLSSTRLGAGAIWRGGESCEFSLAASRVVAKPPRPGQDRVAIMINSLLATSSSTHDAYVNLIEGKCDLNLTARPPSEDEAKLAHDKGVKIELRPIARDALVFIVNRKNQIKTIGSRQIPLIYEGKIKTWAELGGDAQEIWALWRERNSGSRELFDALVTKGQSLPEPKEPRARELLFSSSMAGPYNRVTREPQSLGYSVYYYERYMALSPYTQIVAIDGVEPTAETIASGKYPYTCGVYAAYRPDEPVTSPAMKLLTWLVSPEGQAIIRESGYVPVK